MTHRNNLKRRLVLLLLSGLCVLSFPVIAENDKSPPRHPGYEVDGRTSASVLSAKRSHAVSDQDKFGLGLYSGLIVIGLIVFFVQARNGKR